MTTGAEGFGVTSRGRPSSKKDLRRRAAVARQAGGSVSLTGRGAGLLAKRSQELLSRGRRGDLVREEHVVRVGGRPVRAHVRIGVRTKDTTGDIDAREGA